MYIGEKGGGLRVRVLRSEFFICELLRYTFFVFEYFYNFFLIYYKSKYIVMFNGWFIFIIDWFIIGLCFVVILSIYLRIMFNVIKRLLIYYYYYYLWGMSILNNWLVSKELVFKKWWVDRFIFEVVIFCV